MYSSSLHSSQSMIALVDLPSKWSQQQCTRVYQLLVRKTNPNFLMSCFLTLDTHFHAYQRCPTQKGFNVNQCNTFWANIIAITEGENCLRSVRTNGQHSHGGNPATTCNTHAQSYIKLAFQQFWEKQKHMCGQTSYSTLVWPAHPWWIPGAQIQGGINRIVAMERVNDQLINIDTQHKKASNHHANLPLEMYSFTL